MSEVFKKIVFILSLTVLLNTVIAQELNTISINWVASEQIKLENETLIVPTIENQTWDNGKPTFYYQKKSKFQQANLDFTIAETEIAPEDDVNYLKTHSFNVTEIVELDKKVTSDGRNNYSVVSLFPYVLINKVNLK
jgi:hypothetical protein